MTMISASSSSSVVCEEGMGCGTAARGWRAGLGMGAD